MREQGSGVITNVSSIASIAATPMGHQGTARDVANAALFLASDEAAFVSGVCLAVDGAQSARVG